MTTPSTMAIDSFLNSVNLPSLTDSQLRDLNVPFSDTEIAQAINSLLNGKSPGPDGYSNEYFKLYQSTLTPHLCSAFNHALTGGIIPAENLQATIVTLPKPGKSPDQPANFRPTSLLNSDIKLYAKTLARRLFTVLPTLSNKDQVGFIRGRQAPDGTRRLINIMLRRLRPRLSYYPLMPKRHLKNPLGICIQDSHKIPGVTFTLL